MRNLVSIHRIRRSRCEGARGFTVTELLAVIAIVVILIVVAVPGFQSMIRSSEEAMAESLLATAIKAGRNAAFRAGAGNDAAVVFFFEPGGRCTIVPCVKTGVLRDKNASNVEVIRDIFVAAPDFSPIKLPKYWVVRASMRSDYLDPAGEYYVNGGSAYRYENTGGTDWVFPETGFFDAGRTGQGMNRSSFMIRFQGGTGAVVTTPVNEALVLSPRGTREFQGASPDEDFDPNSPIWGGDMVKFVRAVLNGYRGPSSSLSLAEKQAILGRKSSDMVLVRPVSTIALYNERQLAAGLGVRLNSVTDSLYDAAAVSTQDTRPSLESTAITPQRINRWIEGDTNNNGNIDASGNGNSGDVPLAKLYVLDRYTAGLRRLEVQP